MKKFLIISLAALSLGACANPHDQRLADGALLGGAGGAIIGGVTTGTTGGAVVGGLAGAAVGAVVADVTGRHRYSHHRRHRCYSGYDGCRGAGYNY